MKTYTVVLFDRDEEYVLALMNYLNRGTQIPILSMAFTDENEMLSFLREHKVDLVITEVLSVDIKKTLNAEAPVLFTYYSETKTIPDHSYQIFKYSPASEYIRMILQILSEEKEAVHMSGSGECIAVYSPIGRCGKTKLAESLCACYCSEHMNGKNSLYIGMEEYGVLGKDNYKMNELLYLIKQRSNNISMKLKSMCDRRNGYDSIPSAVSYEELKDLNQEDFKWFIGSLCQEGVYDYILFDVGSASLYSIDVLQEFHVVYLPYLSDEESMQKWNSFCRVVKEKDIPAEILARWYPVAAEKIEFQTQKIQLLEEQRRYGRLDNMCKIQ